MLGGLVERIPGRVRRYERHSAGCEVSSHGFECRAEVVFGGHVHDGVVDEHGIEGASQAHVAHVSRQMFALGVEPAAHPAHPIRGFDKRHGEGVLHVRSVISLSAAELQYLTHRSARRITYHFYVKCRLLGVLRRRRDYRPPVGDVVVESLLHE